VMAVLAILASIAVREPARIIDNLLRWRRAEDAQKSEAENGKNKETIRRGLQEKCCEIIACEPENGPRNCRGPGDS